MYLVLSSIHLHLQDKVNFRRVELGERRADRSRRARMLSWHLGVRYGLRKVEMSDSCDYDLCQRYGFRSHRSQYNPDVLYEGTSFSLPFIYTSCGMQPSLMLQRSRPSHRDGVVLP